MKKLVLGLIAFLMLASMTFSAHATWTINDGIDGYVYRCGTTPIQGIYVRVYSASNNLEGYGVNDNMSKGMLGTDITDENGYFHIAWLKGYLADYTVVAETSMGYIIGTIYVEDLHCGETRRIYFCYCPTAEPYTVGYWKNHPEAWPVDSLTIGGVTYTQQRLLGILWNAKAKDATSMLAAQLIAAKLNVANGVDPTSISDTINAADAFLETHPLGSNPRGADREYALMWKDELDYFNNGY